MRRAASIITVVLLVLFAGVALAEKISNWVAPRTWSLSAKTNSWTQTALVTYKPLPFIPVTPCRVADTRAGSGFPAGYGPPSIGGGVSRNFTITGQCGIPSGAQAVSFNFTVWNTTSYGDFKIYPQGGTVSPVSTLNWGPGILMLANAAIVPLGGGGITVVNEGSGTVDLFFDVNGYYDADFTSNSDYLSLNSTAPGWGTLTAFNTTAAGLSAGVLGILSGNSTLTSAGTIGYSSGAGTGVWGWAGSSGRGVYGLSATGPGVWGQSDGGTGEGVHGLSTGGNGVLGESLAGGVAGILGVNHTATDGTHGVGGFADGAAKVFGVQGAIGTAVTAGSAGVHGIGAATAGITYGVHGESPLISTDSAGIFGRDGHGALALPGLASSSGVRGEGINGVTGVSDSGYGVLGVKISAGPTLDGYGMLGYTSGGTKYGVYAHGVLGASGTKPFVEPHPTDPSKVIRYVALEGNEAGTYFRGTSRIVDGNAVIEVPETYRIVTDEEGMTIQVTPVGAPAVVWVASQDLEKIVLRSSKDVTFHYIVHGVRRAYKDWQVVADGTEYAPRSPKEMLPAFLSEEAKKRLVQNGTYHADGTVNMQTAERMGWAQKWREEELLRQQQAQQAVSHAPQESGQAPKQ